MSCCSYFLNLCKDVFGVETSQVRRAVDSTNLHYGDRTQYTVRIPFLFESTRA